MADMFGLVWYFEMIIESVTALKGGNMTIACIFAMAMVNIHALSA